MSILWILLLLIPFMLYCACSVLLVHGLSRTYRTEQNDKFFVTIIVAARNEAETIKDCLQSLSELDYPAKLLEIIVVNDRSEDGTDRIITEFVLGKSQFKYVTITNPLPSLSGKASAIAQAIGTSRGEIIFITDADCVVPKNWIKQTSRYFADDVGLVAGFALLQSSNGFLHQMQYLDWAYLLGVAAGAAGLGIPLTCMGNNFAIRRSAYEQVGGYQGVGFSVTEDFALLDSIRRKTNWRILFPVDPQTVVISRPMKNFRDFLSQRKRWAIGGQSVHWFGKLLIAISFICGFICWILIFASHTVLLIFSFIFLLIMADYWLLKSLEKKLDAKIRMILLPIYRFFFIVYSTILLIDLLFDRKVIWKGLRYEG